MNYSKTPNKNPESTMLEVDSALLGGGGGRACLIRTMLELGMRTCNFVFDHPCTATSHQPPTTLILYILYKTVYIC